MALGLPVYHISSGAMAPQALVVAAASGHKYLQLAPIRLVQGLSF